VQGTASHQHAARKLARLLRIHFRRVRTSVTGPDLSHRRTLVNTLLTADTVQQVIVQEAKNKGQSVEKIAALARDYADEIAADYSYATVRFLDKVLTWLWNRLYAGIEVKHIERVHRLAKDYELIFTPCHRSHIDYLLLSYVLGHNGLMIPHIAAGKNLNMPIIGAILRRGGAFFMRRSFAGDRLYAAVFNKYLETIIAKGFAIEYFIEGGRSRTGRLLPPRTGMLNMTIRSHLANPHRPIAFIPIYIGYDRVLEGGSYLKELRGRKKKQESIIDIFKVLGRLKQPHGKVYLNFGEEVLLDHILPSSFTIDQDNKSEQLSNAINQLAQQIMVNINQATVVSGVNLIALILLSASNQTLDEPTLVGCIKAYVSLLRQVPYSQALVLPDCKPEQLIHYVEGIGPLQRQPHQLGDILALTPRSSVLMTYYRNNIVQLFVLPSIIACLVLHSHQLQQSTLLERCEQLYPYLQAELFLPWPVTTLTSVIHTWLAALVKHQWLVVDETSVANYCCPARQTNHYFNLELLSRTVAPSLERYYLLLALLIRQGKTGLLQTELENKAVLMGQRLAALHGLNAPEFFDKSLFKGFLQVLHKQHYLDKTTDNKLVANKQTKQLQQLVGQLITADILHSIEHITGSYTRHSE
jgi:glycerol-3-phosphate O-acyltransferase